MRALSLPAVAGLLVLPLVAHAETMIQPGLWEQTEKAVVQDLGEMIPASRPAMCLKGQDASLEKLLMPVAGDLGARTCTGGIVPGSPTNATLALACPAGDAPAIDAALTVRYAPASYEAIGTNVLTAKDGRSRKATVTLTGKRIGDC